MSLVSVNGSGVLRGTISLPKSGAWQGQLEVNSPDDLSGAITIDIGDGRLKLVGTARGGVYVDGTFVRVFAGKDGLGTITQPKFYRSPSVGIVLQDLLRVSGDSLSSTADGTTVNRALPAYAVQRSQVGRSIDMLIRIADPEASWRFLPDGSLWAGPESWPASGLEDDVDVLEDRPEQASMLLGVEAPTLLPGTTIRDKRVSRVQYDFDGVGARMRVWFER